MNDDLSIMKVYAFGTNINNQVCSNTDENKIVFPHELTIQNNQIKCCCETEISPFDKSGEFPDFRIIFSEINCLFNRKCINLFFFISNISFKQINKLFIHFLVLPFSIHKKFFIGKEV